MDTAATTPDSQQTTAKPRSSNKMWLFPCIALIFIIGMGITPTILRKIEESRDERCQANLKKILITLKQYSIDYADHFPDGDGMEGLNKLQGEYITDYSTWLCPSAKTGAIHAKLADKDISYVYFGGYTDYSGDCWPAVWDYPLIFDRPGNHKDHINYANMYWCGTFKTKAKTCSEFIEEFNNLKKKQI